MTTSPDTFDHEALQAMHRLSHAIVQTPRLADICAQILREAVRMIPVRSASILQYDPAVRALRVVASCGLSKSVAHTLQIPVGEGISGRVFASAKPLLVKDARQFPGASRRRRYRGNSLIAAPVAAVPLHIRGRPIGVIHMTDRRDGKAFTERDLALLQTLANQAAAYMHIWTLADEVARARRVDQEMAIARDIQQGLLPRAPMRLPGVDAAGTCLPSAKVGGDYFDLFTRRDGSVGAFIADVAGHHLGAALTMASVRSIVRAEMLYGQFPIGTVMESLNAQLYPDLARAEQFVSAIVVQYDAPSRRVGYCIAGHPPPLLLRNGRVQTLNASFGGVLGVTATDAFPAAESPLLRGDVLLLYTDGLVGVRNARGRAYGESQLQRCFAQQAGRTARQCITAIQHAVTTFAKGTPFADDVTMLALRVKK